MSKIKAPVVQVQLEQPGTDKLLEYTIQTDNRDAIQWDVLRPRKSWPVMNEAPMLWVTFLAWHALRRTGAYSQSVEDFLGVCVSASIVNADGEPLDVDNASQAELEEASAVVPTQTGHDIG